uniref:Glutathione S-transferase n=2 Tax=Parascaris univalens TaxID=6257 RepID=A0A914ZIH6_PARUN
CLLSTLAEGRTLDEMGYKVTYFSIRGLAEPIRLLLTDNEIPFDDSRFKDLAEWQSVKHQFQFGQVPCLHDDNEQIVQSGAILRHLARKHNLNGSNESETTYADMFYEGIRDLHVKYARMIYQAYETEKDSFIKDVLPVELAKFEKLLPTRGGGTGYILGDKICFADYVLFEELDIMQILDPHALEKFPMLKAFHQRMLDRPLIKSYCQKRAEAKVPVNGNGKQ